MGTSMTSILMKDVHSGGHCLTCHEGSHRAHLRSGDCKLAPEALQSETIGELPGSFASLADSPLDHLAAQPLPQGSGLVASPEPRRVDSPVVAQRPTEEPQRQPSTEELPSLIAAWTEIKTHMHTQNVKLDRILADNNHHMQRTCDLESQFAAFTVGVDEAKNKLT